MTVRKSGLWVPDTPSRKEVDKPLAERIIEGVRTDPDLQHPVEAAGVPSTSPINRKTRRHINKQVRRKPKPKRKKRK